MIVKASIVKDVRQHDNMMVEHLVAGGKIRSAEAALGKVQMICIRREIGT